MKEERRKKAQEIAKEMIARYIVEELDEEQSDFGVITITDVSLSSDLSYLDVYVSSLKNESLLTKYMALSAKDMERILCKNLPLIKIPRIRFRYDSTGKDSFEIYQKIQKLDTNEASES